MNLKKALIPVIIIVLLALSLNIYSQNQKAEGYKGLWSASVKSPDYGYKYSGGSGTFFSQHRPVAIYSSKARKTFFVYGGTSGSEESHLQIMVSYFDHRSQKVPKPTIVYDKMGVRDPRDNASLSIDSHGYIWVFISGMGRTRPGFIFKSSQPFSIDKFEKITEEEMVFPQPWWIKDSCFLLLYTKFLKGRELCWSTSADGKTWLSGKQLAVMGGNNQVTGVQKNKLVSVFNFFPGRNPDRQTNLYLVQTEDEGRTWKTVDNKIVHTPLTDIHNEALIKDYEAEKKLVYIKDLNFDSKGNPVILAIISRDFRPGTDGDPREWMIIHWNDNKWNFNKVCESFHNYDMGSLYITADEWRIVGPTEPGPQKYGTGGEIALWISGDEGGTWRKVTNITENSKSNNSYARRPINANKQFYSFWVDGDANNFSESHLYFTDESCKKVWVLPYNMKKDFEKPLRIK
jgi:hypothetical protein